MKKTLFALLFFTIAIISCTDDDAPGPANPSASYMNMKTGSTWTYEQINTAPPGPTTQFILTSTNRDTTAMNQTYHVFTNSSGPNEYYRISGNDYYTFQSLPAALGGAKVENLYLKAGAAVGTSWPQTYNITVSGLPLAVTITNRIEQTGLARTVNAIAYNDVIQVKTSIAVSGVPASALTSDIQSYYAPNVGLIENKNKIDINYFGMVSNTDVSTKIKTATLL